jgi:hypothetical protein
MTAVRQSWRDGRLGRVLHVRPTRNAPVNPRSAWAQACRVHAPYLAAVTTTDSVTTRPVRTDNSYYVNLSVTGRSPSVIVIGPDGVVTPDVTTRPPLPRAEQHHAPAPDDVQDDEVTR